MRCDAIVNTANTKPIIGSGCDYAVYKAAGKRRLSEYREKNIGEVPEGDVFLTPGFRLPAHYVIHAVSPHYIDGAHGEEEKLRGLLSEEFIAGVGTAMPVHCISCDFYWKLWISEGRRYPHCCG